MTIKKVAESVPTEAQIERAAAAEAGEREMYERELELTPGLRSTSWVSVPEQEHIPQNPGQKPDLLPNGNNATIERCAQAAEWFSNVAKFTAEDVAARIRALKDS